MNSLLYPPPIVWPLMCMLTALVIYRQIHEDVRPIMRAVVTGVAASASSNAQAYAIAFGFGLMASGASFVEVFQSLDSKNMAAMSWHQYATLWVKVLNPFVVAVVAYAQQSKFSGAALNGIPTTPPSPPKL